MVDLNYDPPALHVWDKLHAYVLYDIVNSVLRLWSCISIKTREGAPELRGPA